MERNESTTRRRFLTVGGAAVAFSVVAAACGGSEGGSDQLPVTGTLPVTDRPPVVNISADNDVTMLRTAQSVEALAVLTYNTVLSKNVLDDAAIIEAVRLFQVHHTANVSSVGALVQAAGGQPYTQPNPYLLEQIIQPGLDGVDSQVSALGVLYEIENTTAQTEIFCVEVLSRAQLRQGIAAIGASCARAVSVLNGFQGQPPVAFPLMPLALRAPEKAYLPE